MKKRSRTRLSSSCPTSLLLKKEDEKVISLELLAAKCHSPRGSGLFQPDFPFPGSQVTKPTGSVQGPKAELVVCSKWGRVAGDC